MNEGTLRVEHWAVEDADRAVPNLWICRPFRRLVAALLVVEVLADPGLVWLGSMHEWENVGEPAKPPHRGLRVPDDLARQPGHQHDRHPHDVPGRINSDQFGSRQFCGRGDLERGCLSFSQVRLLLVQVGSDVAAEHHARCGVTVEIDGVHGRGHAAAKHRPLRDAVSGDGLHPAEGGVGGWRAEQAPGLGVIIEPVAGTAHGRSSVRCMWRGTRRRSRGH